MTAADWAEIDIYVDSPVAEAERQRLVASLQDKLNSSQERQFALAALDSAITADGTVTEEERLAFQEIRSALEHTNLQPLSGLSRLSKSSSKPSPASATAAPNRELFIDDYIKNRIFYNINRRLEAEKLEPEISEDLLLKLSLAGRRPLFRGCRRR